VCSPVHNADKKCVGESFLSSSQRWHSANSLHCHSICNDACKQRPGHFFSLFTTCSLTNPYCIGPSSTWNFWLKSSFKNSKLALKWQKNTQSSGTDARYLKLERVVAAKLLHSLMIYCESSWNYLLQNHFTFCSYSSEVNARRRVTSHIWFFSFYFLITPVGFWRNLVLKVFMKLTNEIKFLSYPHNT